jgi:hypothetical protein
MREWLVSYGSNLIHLLSVDGQQTKAVLAETCMGVFFIRSVSDTVFKPFIPKPPRTTGNMRTTV